MTAAELAQDHWNKTPLWVPEEQRYRLYPWLYEAAEFRQHAGHKVLEIGCGTGSDLVQFAKHGAEAYGIDITAEHVRLAKQRVGSTADVRYGDGRQIPFPSGSFDYVYCHGVLMHSDEPRKIVDEIFRVLKPGGRFNVHVYAQWSYFTAWKMMRHGRNWKNHIENSSDTVHIDLYTAPECRRLFYPSKVVITKRQCKPFQMLAPLFGWFLIVKGHKP